MANTKIIATLGPASNSGGVPARPVGGRGQYLPAQCVARDMGGACCRYPTYSRGSGLDAARGCHLARICRDPKYASEDLRTVDALSKTDSFSVITVESILGTPQRASTDYSNFAKDVKPGDSVLLADAIFDSGPLSLTAPRFVAVSSVAAPRWANIRSRLRE